MASPSGSTVGPDRPRRLEELVDALQGRGRYTFQRAEAISTLGIAPENLKKAARLLARKRRLVSPRRGFYVIVPVEHRAAGAPPASWFIDDLMRALDAPYYVGVLTAAAQHGASHQAPQEFQVVTARPQRPITAGRNRIRFIAKARLERTAVVPVKTYTGTMRVSTAEATAVDLLRYVEHAGFLSNVATVLRDLAEPCEPGRLVQAAEADGELAHAQRLGYVLDLIGVRRLADPLAQWLDARRPSVVRLNPAEPERGAPRDRRWRLIVNDTVEPDR